MGRTNIGRSNSFALGFILSENQYTGYLYFGLYLTWFHIEINLKKLHEGY